MTVILDRTPVSVRRATLRTLSRLEARRYARHPLFLTGTMLLVVVTALTSTSRAAARPVLGEAVYPAFLLGIVGLLVAHRLTLSTRRARDVIEAAPADGVTRTAAMCLACLVSLAAGILWFAWTQLAWALWPPDGQADGFGRVGSGNRLAIMLAGSIASFGGPLLGVANARWLRMRGAALAVAFALVAWALAGDRVVELDPQSRARNLLRLTAPYTIWTTGAPGKGDWRNAGSPLWRLAYLAALCGLAAVTAVLSAASGDRRRRLLAVGAVVAAVGAGALLLAAFTGPDMMRL